MRCDATRVLTAALDRPSSTYRARSKFITGITPLGAFGPFVPALSTRVDRLNRPTFFSPSSLRLFRDRIDRSLAPPCDGKYRTHSQVLGLRATPACACAWGTAYRGKKMGLSLNTCGYRSLALPLDTCPTVEGRTTNGGWLTNG